MKLTIQGSPTDIATLIDQLGGSYPEFHLHANNTQVTPPEIQADAAEQEQPSKFDRLMNELQDPRYTLRSVSELVEKTGYADQASIEDALVRNDEEYVTKRRRSDGAALIGLASRN